MLNYQEYEMLQESLMILEDSDLSIRARIDLALQKLNSIPSSLKKTFIAYIIALASTIGIDNEVKAEIATISPEYIIPIIPGLKPISDVPEVTETETDTPTIIPYGYNLKLSDEGYKWLKTKYASAMKKDKKSFDDEVEKADAGIKKIFVDWKKQGKHIQLTQKMYDALVMLAVRKGVSYVRTSTFIQDVKQGKHLQASQKLASMDGSIWTVKNIASIVSHEVSLFKSYLKNEWKAKVSGVKVEVPKGYTVHGIDVSKYQGNINWTKVKKLNTKTGINIDFVFIKATRGNTTVDPKFRNNWDSVANHGIARGAYHYFSPGVSGREQALNFIRTVKLIPGDLPPVLDYEEKASTEQVKIWLKLVEEHYGVKPIIYTGATFYRDNLGKDFDGYVLWISHGPFNKLTNLNIPTPATSRKWSFWQFSDKAVIPGIDGKADLNVFNGNKAALNKLVIKEKGKAKTQTKPKAKTQSKKPIKKAKKTKSIRKNTRKK